VAAGSLVWTSDPTLFFFLTMQHKLKTNKKIKNKKQKNKKVEKIKK
jgi:hypothetical protein